MVGGIVVLTGREKATIFLSILGEETSSRILRYLPDELADLIAAGINHLPTPSPDALAEVLREFKSYLALPAGSVAGLPRLEERPRPAPGARRSYAFLLYERPQLIAYLLSLIEASAREEILLSLPREKALVEELLAGLKPNSLSAKLAQTLKEQFAAKLF